MSTIGLLPEEKTRKMHGRRVSEETIYSVQTNHSNPYHRSVFLQRRANKQHDTLSFKSNGSSSYVAQRVLSAKVLRVKELQNELQEVKTKLHEVMSENKLLRNLQKRQDTALARYEDTSAALPRLLENHRAEVTTLKAHAREVRAAARSLHRKLQRSEAELIRLREEHDKLKQIVEDKELESRVELQKRVEDLEDRLKEMREKNLNLNRKLEVEQKSHSQQLAAEISKRKSLQKELQAAFAEIARLGSIIQQGQYSSRLGDGDNESQVTSVTGLLTSRSTKSLQKKIVPHKNIANPKKKLNSHSESKITRTTINLKHKKIMEENSEKDEPEKDIPIDLHKKLSVESLGSVSNEDKNVTMAQRIVEGLKSAEDEYFTKHEEEYGVENDEEVNNSQSRRKDINGARNKHDKPKPNELLSEDEKDWYGESSSAQSKSNINSSTSHTSCERTESKSSDRPQTNFSSADSFEIHKTTTKTEHESDESSDEENTTIKIRIKKDLYRTRKSNSDSNGKIEDQDSNKDLRSSRYTKTTRNNLTKIQDHLDKFDDDISSYVERKTARNRSNSLDDTPENALKQRQFEEYIKKLENIDRLNENLTSVRNQFKEKQFEPKENEDAIIKPEQYEDSELSSDEPEKDDNFQRKYHDLKNKNDSLELSRGPKKSSQLNDIDFNVFDPDKYLQEIDNSYKLIRQRINEENEKMNEQLQQYCKEVESDVQKTNEALDKQKQNLRINQLETDKLEREIRTNVKINEQLKLARIDSSKKSQLLAALKAIDHGQDIVDFNANPSSTDVPEPTPRRRMDKKQLMKDLFE